MFVCETCGGTGTVSLTLTCRKCQGTGELITYDDDGNENLETCTLCEDGVIFSEATCEVCKGTGVT